MTLDTDEWVALRLAHDRALAGANQAGNRAHELAEHREAVRNGRAQLCGSSPEQLRQAMARAELAQQRAMAGQLRAQAARQRAETAKRKLSTPRLPRLQRY